MCYLNKNLYNFYNEREALQDLIIENKLDIEFYKKIKAINLIRADIFKEDIYSFFDCENSIRKILSSIILLSNKNVIIDFNIKNTKYLYYLNPFLFELTFSEVICNAIINAIENKIELNIKFSKMNLTIELKYKGKFFIPIIYNTSAYVKTGNTKNNCFIKICFNIKSKINKNKKPPKIDSFIKNRISPLYIALYNSKLITFK